MSVCLCTYVPFMCGGLHVYTWTNVEQAAFNGESPTLLISTSHFEIESQMETGAHQFAYTG